ncbi:hypothetical protein GYMLUDRAFT_701502, partial [Collybiopsis luxurians FD-317 M1]
MKQFLRESSQFTSAEKISQEITKYFGDIGKAFDTCRRKVLFHIERDTTNISKEIFLSNLKPSTEAFHDYRAGRPSCTEGTRVKILENITQWADTSETEVYWMGGMAGTGKSTIAKSLCETFEEKMQILAGAFFCSRQLPDCRDHTKIIPTIAYQLAHFSCTFAEALTKELQKDSKLAEKEIKKQIRLLLLEPWKKAANISELTGKTPVIVIDALDECENIQLVLEPLLEAIKGRDLPGLKFLFTSRPDQPVYNHLIIAPHDSRIFLHNVETSLVEGDIARFLSDSFQEYNFAQENISQLAKLSGKLFIFAATIVKWVTTGKKSVAESRLRDALKLQYVQDTTDKLYNVILEKVIAPSGNEIQNEERTADLKVLHSVITVRSPVSCEVIAQMTKVKLEQVKELIDALQSVLYVGKAEAIYVFHVSFSDFLFRKQANEQLNDLYCDQLIQHCFLGNACFDIMNKELRFNILNLPSSFQKDKEVENIESDVDNKIEQSLVYACKSWGYHLEKSTKDVEKTTNLMETVQEFLKEKIIYWVEVMSVLRVSKHEQETANDTLVQCMDILNLIEKIPNLPEKFQQTIRSVRSAVETFLLSPANGMTPHWYLSILPFWKRDIAAIEQGLKMGSIVKRQMEKPNLSVWYAGSEINSIAISDNGERVVSGGDDNMVRIWNAKTGAP